MNRATGKVRRRGPVTPVRYERNRPSELLHVDVKMVTCMPKGGGWRARWIRPGADYAFLHVAVDDFSRVAYAAPPDERKGSARAFMSRCLAFFSGFGFEVERMNRTLAQEWQ